MKQFLAALSIAVAFCGCNSDSNKKEKNLNTYLGSDSVAPPRDTVNAAILLFEEGSHDFGVIEQGEKVIHNYKFKNVGKSPLIITEATSSCGCTVPEVPKEPIKPGQTGILKVIFDSAGKVGTIQKVVTVNSNAAKQYTDVYLSGEIKLPPTKK